MAPRLAGSTHASTACSPSGPETETEDRVQRFAGEAAAPEARQHLAADLGAAVLQLQLAKAERTAEALPHPGHARPGEAFPALEQACRGAGELGRVSDLGQQRPVDVASDRGRTAHGQQGLGVLLPEGTQPQTRRLEHREGCGEDVHRVVRKGISPAQGSVHLLVLVPGPTNQR